MLQAKASGESDGSDRLMPVGSVRRRVCGELVKRVTGAAGLGPLEIFWSLAEGIQGLVHCSPCSKKVFTGLVSSARENNGV